MKQLAVEAKKRGVDVKGLRKGELIAAILAAEEDPSLRGGAGTGRAGSRPPSSRSAPPIEADEIQRLLRLIGKRYNLIDLKDMAERPADVKELLVQDREIRRYNLEYQQSGGRGVEAKEEDCEFHNKPECRGAKCMWNPDGFYWSCPAPAPHHPAARSSSSAAHPLAAPLGLAAPAVHPPSRSSRVRLPSPPRRETFL